MNFEQYLLTRFCVNVWQGANGSGFKTVFGRDFPMAPDAWMEHRLDLFERFCAPSIANQDEKNFVWLLFVDPLTPQKYLDEIKRIVGDSVEMILLKADRTLMTFAPSGSVASKAIKARLKKETEWVLTSRADNDDMLDRQYIQLIQQRATAEQRKLIIDIPHGYLYRPPNELQLRHHTNGSPFVSFLEPAIGPIKTVISVQHTQTGKLGPMVTIGGRRWIRTYHEGNAASRWTAGKLVPFDAAMLGDRFGYQAEGLA